jgi:phosphoglycolate phosphatase
LSRGFKNLLKKFRPDFGLGVATNKNNTIGKVLEYNDLKILLNIVFSSLDVKNLKPHPEALLKILDFFNIPPQHLFYIGDPLLDNKSTQASGGVFIYYYADHPYPHSKGQ